MKKSLLSIASGVLVLAATTARAEGVVAEGGHHVGVGTGLGLSAVYALFGTLLLLVCFKVFDKILTKVDLEGEVRKGNVAAGILSAAVLIAIAVIIAASIAG